MDVGLGGDLLVDVRLGGDLLVDIRHDLGGSAGRGDDSENDLKKERRVVCQSAGENLPGTAWWVCES